MACISVAKYRDFVLVDFRTVSVPPRSQWRPQRQIRSHDLDVCHVGRQATSTRIFFVQKRRRIDEWKEKMAKTEMCKFHSLCLCFGVMCSVGCSVKSKRDTSIEEYRHLTAARLVEMHVKCYAQCYGAFKSGPVYY